MKITILLSVFLSFFSALAAPVSLGDLNKVSIPKSLSLFVQSGDKIFFSRATDDLGEELWITDGTPAGTVLLKDIEPGPVSSQPFGFTPAKFAGKYGAYFFANTSANGYELWKTDGTTLGTSLVKDINPGSDGSVTSSLFSLNRAVSDPEQDYVFFAADNGVSGEELWFSLDGTEFSTGFFDLEMGVGSSSPEQLQIAENVLVFVAETAAQGKETWVYSGFFPFPIDDIVPGVGSSASSNIHLIGDALVFQADNGVSGNELWRADGSNPSEIIADLTPGVADSQLLNLTKFSDSKLLFSRLNSVDFSIELRSTDGTAGNTPLVKSLNCVPGGLLNFIAGTGINISSAISPVINGVNIFPCLGVFSSEVELWKSDGTEGGTQLVKEIFKGDASADIIAFSRGNNRLIFAANNGVNGFEPWTSDGSSVGTRLIKDYNPGEASSMNPEFYYFTLFNSPKSNSTASLFPITIKKKTKILYSDGTVANSKILFDDSSDLNYGSNPQDFISIGANVFFAAKHSTLGREMFITRGSRRSTKVFKNINTGGDSNPQSFVKLNPRQAVFQASTSKKGTELFVTDGTEAGTQQIKNLFKGNSANVNFNLFQPAIRNKIYFNFFREDIGAELWVTNGTKRGTKLVKDINPGAASAATNELVRLGGRAVFEAEDSVSGEELWITNGKSSGTKLIKDIVPGAGNSDPYELVSAGDKVIFGATAPGVGTELWVTDGTSEGTVMLKDIRPGASSSFPFGMTYSDGFVFFYADDGVHGTELWRTDGTSDGTFMVQDLKPGAASTTIYQIESLGSGAIVLKANNGSGTKLWTANGSAGSMLSLEAEISSFSDSGFYKLPGTNKVVFNGYNIATGSEPWITDGTLAGTNILADVLPGTQSSNPQSFFAKGKKLFFSADTEAKGREPFIIKLP